MNKQILLMLVLLSAVSTGWTQGYHSSRFSYEGSNRKIIGALHIADSIYALPSFWRAVEKYPEQKIDNSSYTMKMLADTLRAFAKPAVVKRLGGIHPFATAKTGAQGISLTKKGYKQDLYSLAVTFIHEWVHVVDNAKYPGDLRFAHYEKQEPCLNRDTASYRVERIVELMLGWPDFAVKCPPKNP